MGVCPGQPTVSHLRMVKHFLAFTLMFASLTEALPVLCKTGNCIGANFDNRGVSSVPSNTGSTHRRPVTNTGHIGGDIIVTSNTGNTGYVSAVNVNCNRRNCVGANIDHRGVPSVPSNTGSTNGNYQPRAKPKISNRR